MIKSMTGYGRGEYSNSGYNMKIEIKTVNHRYNDISVRMPRHMSYLEESIKKMIKENISRGKVDVYVNLEYVGGAPIDIKVDMELARSYRDSLERINSELELPGEIRINNVLSLSDIIKTEKKEIDEELLWEVVRVSLEEALEDLMGMKYGEGQELQDDMIANLDQVDIILEEIELRSPEVVREYRDKLRIRIDELLDGSIEIDDDKLSHEVAYFADKSNINEEVIRLKSHIGQFREILKEEETVGRKLDFLMQEMNREINTIGSKANDVHISSRVVAVKAEIEKIREQVQNLE